MTKTKVWVSILAAASSIGLVAYAVSRRASPVQQADSKAPASVNGIVPVVLAAAPSSEEGHTVAFLVRAPRLAGADDAEALDPDDLGRDWLSRAAQSEPSVGELDLDVALDDIADPTAEADIIRSLDAPQDAEEAEEADA